MDLETVHVNQADHLQIHRNPSDAWSIFSILQCPGELWIASRYVDNKLEGVRIQLDQRSQVTTQEFYSNGNYHGEKTTYKFGRPQEIIPYSNGIIDGRVRRYYVNGKMMEEIEYKNGKQDGIYHHYNEKEQLDLKYVYKNGEKVSGGMVEVGGDK